MSDDFDISQSVLKPKFIFCDGRKYRVLGNSCMVGNYEENEIILDECSNTDIVENAAGLFEIVLKNIPVNIVKKVISKKMNQEIQFTYGTKLEYPDKNSNGLCKLSSTSKKSLNNSIDFIWTLLEDFRSKMSPTHFISIPIISSEIKQNFIDFKQEVLKDPKINEKYFVSPNKLHITIIMISLINEDEKETVIKEFDYIITSIKENILKNPFEVTVRGLDIMNDDPTEVKILYAKVEDNSYVLQNIVDKIFIHMKNQKFCFDEFSRDSVKIHITLMKSTYEGHNSDSNTFDATNILQKYENHYFGRFEPNIFHFSSRYHTDSQTGYYDCIHKIEIK